MDDDSAPLTSGSDELSGEMTGILSSDTFSSSNSPFPSRPYLTQSLPGTGGEMKSIPEDFVVEEIPAFPFSGEGEHLILRVEKRGLTTEAAKVLLARAFQVGPEEIGYSGIKDSFALTRQDFSIHTKLDGFPPPPSPEAPNLLLPSSIRILSKTRHSHKLRAGMLLGNRFSITIRNARFPENAGPIIEVLSEKGIPNYYGTQRFGSLRNVSGKVGSCLVKGDFEGALRTYVSETGPEEGADVKRARALFSEGDLKGALENFPRQNLYERLLIQNILSDNPPKKAFFRAIPGHLVRLMVSAMQSEIFNEIVSQRISTIGEFIEGDIGMFSRGAVFFRNAPKGDPRLKTREVSPSGLLAGYKVPVADSLAGEIEENALRKFGFSRETLPSLKSAPLRFPIEGARRRLRECALDGKISHSVFGRDIRLEFSLPKGTYATELLREVMKGSA